jgi:hypothetical protein
MDEALGTLQDALTDLVVTDVATLTDGEVHRHLMDVTAELSRLQAVQFKLAEVWRSRRVWAEDGSRSAGARLARETHLRRGSANEVIRRAKAVAAMPAALSALEDGAITVDHVDLLAAANTSSRRDHFVEYEVQLVAFCRQLPYWQADKAVQYWGQRVDALTGHDDGPAPTFSNRQASSFRGIDGEIHVKAIFDRVGGAMFAEAWDRIDNEFRLADEQQLAEQGVLPRTAAQRRLDALVELAIRATGDGGGRPRPLVTVTIGDQSFKRLCELSDGTVIAPGELVPYLSDLDVHTIIFNGPFHAIAGSTARCFTGLLRRAIEVRDRHCQHPASDGDPINRCDVDHIVPKADGGLTCQHNGELLERGRNRDPRRRNLTAADITVWHDDPLVIAARQRIDALCRRRRGQAP